MASTSTSGRGEQERDPFLVLEPPIKNIKSTLSAKHYDVFINHRGPDVKTTLAQQLYDSLQQAGIRAYLDAPETELGDYFPSAIKNAIFSATVHIAILSPRYAESPWCLAELDLMFQTKARIIPLFYHVEPSDFRYIKNRVADAFSKHEEKGRYPNYDVQQWKERLQNVSWLKGYELNGQNEDQSKVCNDVVAAVVNEKQKRKIPLQVAKYEVGLDELVNDFHSHCERNGQMRDTIIGIYGMGGSGKTTLAKYLFNRKHSEFSESTFLFDVQEKHVKGELTSLQNKLLTDLHLEGNTIASIEDGIAVIKDNLQRSRQLRFLIVVDNVDNLMQLEALVHIDVLNPNSLVIVTTRDERLLIQSGVRVRYKMKEMNPEHSRQLFNLYAFRRQSCKSGFDNLVDSFVDLCRGLPLSLQVMGAHVSGSNKGYWELQLDSFKARLHTGINNTLKISYDALEEDQKQIFMDIACFFKEERVSRAISIWKASGWRAEHALQTLKDKCLVEIRFEPMWSIPDRIDNYEPPCFFIMHDHIRDMGREMADDEMNQPRRLWRPKDLIGMQEIKGFKDILKGSEGKRFRCYSRIEDSGSNLDIRYFVESSRTSADLRWLDLEYKIPQWIPLQHLHTLNLEENPPWRLWQRDVQVSFKLKELHCFFRHIHKCLSQDMCMRDLNELLSSIGMSKHLESLHLQFESDVVKWNIEWNCLLKSVREFANLRTLELISFQLEGEFALGNRGETTDDQFCMGSLEAITLCGAFKTRRVSISGQSCPTLKSLKLYSMEDLIEVDVTGVTTLECLVLMKCGKLRKVLSNDLPNLETLQIKICRAITKLPNFGWTSCLKRISISRCWNLQDISAIERFKGLKTIWIAYCPELKNIKAIEQLKRLKRIWINESTKLQDVICFKELRALKTVFIGNCSRLQNIEGIESLIYLESIVITSCPQLQHITGIEELKELKKMIIADSPIISCVERLQKLPCELTITVGRSAMSDLTADKIGDTLSMVDGFCEIDRQTLGKLFGDVEQRNEDIKKIIHSFYETQHSVSTFIFCAMGDWSPKMPSDCCNVRSTLHDLYLGPKPSFPAIEQRMIYTCVFNKGRFSNYDSWMPSEWYMKKAFLMGVKKGEERQTLHILQTLVAQLCVAKPCVGNTQYCEDPRENLLGWVDHDDFADEYDDDEEEYDDYNDNVS